MDNDSMTALVQWGPIVLMAALFYFLLYRPQQNAQRRRREMLAALKVGDRVITLAGIYGTIEELNDELLSLRVADNVVLKLARSAVSGVVDKEKGDLL